MVARHACDVGEVLCIHLAAVEELDWLCGDSHLWSLHEAGGESTISGYLVFLLMGSRDNIAVAVNSQSNTPSHFSVFENALTYVQVFSEHLHGNLSIIDSALTLFTFGRASDCSTIFKLDSNDGIERVVDLHSRAMLRCERISQSHADKSDD